MWLKGLASELESEDPGARYVSSPNSYSFITGTCFQSRSLSLFIAIPKPFRLTADIADRLLIARLEIDSEAMSYVLNYLRSS